MKKKFKRISFLMLIMTIVIIPQITYAESSTNAPSDWAKVEIEKAIDINLIPEKIQGEYKNSITREEFSELTVKLYESLSGKEGLVPDENPFIDTKNTKVMIANDLGIVQGRGNGNFDPNNTVSREELTVMLYRTLQAAKPQFSFSNSQEYIFEDSSLISSWAQEAVNYLYGVEVINGVGNNRFNPDGDASREEAIVLVKRLNEKVVVATSTSKNKLIVSRASISRQESLTKYKLQTLIAQEMGKPYMWGGTGPDGYDCSGLVYSIYGKLGISLPRTSKTQASAGTYVAKKDLIYGDLVFFARDGKNINHVGIYVGNGEFAHSPETGDVVKTTTLMSGYYANSYYTARRVLP